MGCDHVGLATVAYSYSAGGYARSTSWDDVGQACIQLESAGPIYSQLLNISALPVNLVNIDIVDMDMAISIPNMVSALAAAYQCG